MGTVHCCLIQSQVDSVLSEMLPGMISPPVLIHVVDDDASFRTAAARLLRHPVVRSPFMNRLTSS
jgi:hypothetical protein